MAERLAGELSRRQRLDVATKRLAVAAAALAVGVSVVVVTSNTVKLRQVAADTRATLSQIESITSSNRQVSRALLDTAQRLTDCTTPTGRCYQRGQARTAEAVGQINVITYAAAACADRPGHQLPADIRRCVTRVLAHADNNP